MRHLPVPRSAPRQSVVLRWLRVPRVMAGVIIVVLLLVLSVTRRTARGVVAGGVRTAAAGAVQLTGAQLATAVVGHAVGRAPLLRQPDPGASLRLITFSLYAPPEGSARPQDTAGLVMNIAAARRWYPGWVVRVYVSAGLDPGFVALVVAMGAQVRIRPVQDVIDGKAMLWRYEALDDPNVERVVARDLDSRLSPREAAAVAEWVRSGRVCHAMRDNFWHGVVLLGGMTGCMRAGVVAELGTPIRSLFDKFWELQYSAAHPADAWGPDQVFLGTVVWPHIQRDTLVHCSWYCHLGGAVTHPFATNQTEAYFVGSRAEPTTLLECDADVADDGFKMCSPRRMSVPEVAAMLLTHPTAPVNLDGCATDDCRLMARTLRLVLPSWLPGWSQLSQEEQQEWLRE